MVAKKSPPRYKEKGIDEEMSGIRWQSITSFSKPSARQSFDQQKK